MATVAFRIRNSLAAVNRHGVIRYSRRLARYFSELIYKRHISTVFRRDLSKPVALIDARLPVRIEAYSGARYDQLHAFLDPFVRPDIVDGRLEDSWTPMLAYHKGDIVGVSWFATHPIYLDSIECYLAYGPGASYIEGSRTSASVRGMGIGPAIRTRICAYLRDLGYANAYVSAGDDNTASQNVARKCGFIPFESVRLTRILWHRRYVRFRYDIAQGA